MDSSAFVPSGAKLGCPRKLRRCRAVSMASDRKVLVISGPTAVGKSSLAIKLAQRLDGEIISADSVQVYRNLDVGSNKPSEEERRTVKHHLIDVALPEEDDYSAGQFFHDARAATQDALGRGKLPIVVGGTSMYVRWFVYGKPPTAESSPEVREQVEREVAEVHGDWNAALNLLSELDKSRAEKLEKNDWYRLKRSLEIIRSSDRTITDLPDVGAAPAAVMPEKSDLDVRCIFLIDSRQALFKRIDERCEIMLAKNGLISEVAELLLENRLRLESSPTRAIGYRQVIEYLLARKLDLEGVEDPKAAFRSFLKVFMSATRQYARKQMQWFRSDKNFLWLPIYPADFEMNYDNLEYEAERLISLDREAFDAEVASSTQTRLRELYSAEGPSMKRYISQPVLITPDGQIERKLLAEVENSAARLRAEEMYIKT
ncbi:hypothetical protein NDN08_001084 [Rhodosorus marinus]|uniref:tRNA dimethylallyltransferase n=1 Tax=Rhodosorus marinus TaxID=101924 RepID=A0AAV8UPX4_9RHOD|nr:hypothetical protein NDN08_001084 [Rhodosorus marinus]